jgi:hypothetical protein
MQLGVGHNPDSFSSVRGANGGSSQHSPLSIKPQRGQVSKDCSKSSNSEHWAVFHKDPFGSSLANDPRHFSPHPRAFAVESCAFSCCRYVLARKPARNHVNKSAPRLSVKGANVIPNWERRESAFVLSGGEYASGKWVPFNGTNGSPPEQLAAEYSSTSAREKSQLIHFSSGRGAEVKR